MTSRVRACVLAVTFAAIVALPSVAAAQTPASIGVKAGVNFATLKGDDIEDEGRKSLVGAAAGLFVSKAINDTVGWRLEGLFSQKGVKFDDGTDEGKFKLTYVDVPFLVTVGPSSSSATRFNVFTGPQLSLKVSEKAEANGEEVDREDQAKGTDFGWVLGAGIDSGRFSADARYVLGLTKIAKDGDDVKNGVFSVMVGVKFR